MKSPFWQYRTHSPFGYWHFIQRKRPWRTWRNGAQYYSKTYAEFIPFMELARIYDYRKQCGDEDGDFCERKGLLFSRAEAEQITLFSGGRL